MGIRSNQIRLDLPWSYNGVTPSTSNDIASRSYTDGIVDGLRKRLFRIPPELFDNVETDFTLPESADTTSVEVYRNFQRLDESEYTMTDATTLQFVNPPQTALNEWIVVRYYPTSGNVSTASKRYTSVVKTVANDGQTLLLSEVVDRILIADTSGGGFSLYLPALTEENEGTTTFIKCKGAGSFVLYPTGVTIDRGLSFRTLTNGQSLRLVAARLNTSTGNWYAIKKMNVTYTGLEALPTQTNSLSTIIRED